MKNHPHQKGVLEPASREIQELTQKNTFKHVERTERTQIIPLTWVYRYKFDTDSFLTKYKSRLMCTVRGDLRRLAMQQLSRLKFLEQ